jgi:hypothetical protein
MDHTNSNMVDPLQFKAHYTIKAKGLLTNILMKLL